MSSQENLAAAHKKSSRPWPEIAMELIQEKNDTKVLRLHEELNQAIDEQGFVEKTRSLNRILSNMTAEHALMEGSEGETR